MILLSITIIDDDDDDEAVVYRITGEGIPIIPLHGVYTPPASKHLFIFPPRVQTSINILSSR